MLVISYLQALESEQLSAPNKTRARGPAGRRLPSFKHSKHARRQNITENRNENEDPAIVGDDIENNNVEANETEKNNYFHTAKISEETSDHNVVVEEECIQQRSLPRRRWKACRIL